MTSLPADILRRDLLRAGRPQQLQTTIDGLAEACTISPEQIRTALDGFLYCAWASVTRHDRSVDRRELASLAGHAKFRIDFDWSLIGSAGEDEDFELSNLQWQASPWGVYQSVATDRTVNEAAVRVVAELYFEMVKPTGGTFLTSLGDISAAQATSVRQAAEALTELEKAGWLTWNGRTQQAILEATRRRDTTAEGSPSSRRVEQSVSAITAHGGGVSS